MYARYNSSYEEVICMTNDTSKNKASTFPSVRAQADSELIHWLLHKSNCSRSDISKATGVSESTLSRIADGSSSMERVLFGSAYRLTDYARRLQSK